MIGGRIFGKLIKILRNLFFFFKDESKQVNGVYSKNVKIE